MFGHRIGGLFEPGDRVTIVEGSFESFEGIVEAVDSERGVVTIVLTIFGKPVPIDIETWQIERV
jgi:transcriptional antiterminator NusG